VYLLSDIDLQFFDSGALLCLHQLLQLTLVIFYIFMFEVVVNR